MKANLELMTLALLIKKSSVLDQEFETDVLNFWQEFYRATRPNKFIVDGTIRTMISGKVVIGTCEDSEPHRILSFQFSDGSSWQASLLKSTTPKIWNEANVAADRLIAQYAIVTQKAA